MGWELSSDRLLQRSLNSARDFAGGSWKISGPMKALTSFLAISLVFGLAAARAEESKSETKVEPKKEETNPAAQEEKKNMNEVAVIKTTEGEMVLEFWPDV